MRIGGFLFGLIVLGSVASADTIVVTNEAAITADGSFVWGSIGAKGTFPTNSFAIGVTGIPGLSATVSQAEPKPFQRWDQGPATGSYVWAGNFATGEELLYTGATGPGSTFPPGHGPMTILLSGPVQAIGFQIQSNRFGSFDGVIEAFDAGNASLGMFSVAGVSNGDADDSAIFLGILSDAQNITKIVLDVANTEDGKRPHDFTINGGRIDLTADPVPEPATCALFGVALAAYALRRRRRRKE